MKTHRFHFHFYEPPVNTAITIIIISDMTLLLIAVEQC